MKTRDISSQTRVMWDQDFSFQSAVFCFNQSDFEENHTLVSYVADRSTNYVCYGRHVDRYQRTHNDGLSVACYYPRISARFYRRILTSNSITTLPDAVGEFDLEFGECKPTGFQSIIE